MLVSFFSSQVSAADREIQAIWTDTPPKIDGRLDEPIWQQAPAASGFIQREPHPGQPPTHQTFARVLYDRDYLYVGIVAMKTDMHALAVTATRRDSRLFSDDFLQVELDTYHDHRNCYVFALNPLGTRVDARVANEGSNAGREGTAYAWDCDWRGQAWRGEDRWSVEFAIPFSELRFPKGEGVVWGINFRRNDESLEEESSWSDLGNNDWAVSRFGHLVGLNTLRLNTRRPFEVKPYVTAKPQSLDGHDWEIGKDGGVDLRYSLDKFTFDLTLNPDFAQIEADPERVNLTDIPLRFPEKRPFFQEGAELFSMPIELFYSRRVEDLISGAKMVGKSGPHSVALISAYARPEHDPEAPASNFTVARFLRDMGARSSLGVLMVNKQSPEHYDRALGTDFRWEPLRDLRVQGQAAFNWNSDHPRSYGMVLFSNYETQTWRASMGVFDSGRDFNVEAGFIPRFDRRGYRASVGYRYPTRSNKWRRLYAGVEGEQLWNHDGQLMNERIELHFSMGYRDFFTFFGPSRYFHVDDEGQRFTDETLGGFLGWFPPKWASIRSGFSIGRRNGKRSFFVGPEITLRPTEQFALEFNLQRLVEENQLVYLIRRFSLSYQFTQRMYLKGSAEFTQEGDRRLFAVYGYEYQPESYLFLVYTDNREREEEGKTSHERIFFFKISYLMRLRWF